MADKKISALTAATTPLAGTEVLPIVQSGSTVKVSAADITASRAVSVGSLDSAGDASIGTTNSGLTQLIITTTGEATDQKTWRFQTGTGVGAGVLRLRAVNDAATSGQNAWVVNRTADNIDSQNFLTGGANRLSLGASDVTVNTGNLIQGTAAKGVNFTANTGAAGMTSQLLNWYEEGTWTPTFASTTGSITSMTSVSGTYTRVGNLVTIIGQGKINNNGTGAGVITVTGFPFTLSSGMARYPGSGGEVDIVGFGLFVFANQSDGKIYLEKVDGSYPGGAGYNLIFSVSYQV